MSFQDLRQRALTIRQKYAEFEQQQHGREWSREQLVQGFVGDVGDLVKLTMAVDGARHIPDAQAKLRHELADCLWSLIVIAEKYDVDLEAAFGETMDELEEKLQQHV